MLYIKLFGYKSSIILLTIFTLLMVVVGIYLPLIVGLSNSLVKFINGPLEYDKIMNTQSLTIYTSSIPLQIPLSFYMLSNKTGFAADVGLTTVNNKLTVILGLDINGYSILGLRSYYPSIIIGKKLAEELGIDANDILVISSNYCNRILVARARILSLRGVLNYTVIAPLNVTLKLNCRLPNTVSVFYIIEKDLVEKYVKKKYALNIVVPGEGKITIKGLDGSLFYEGHVKNNISIQLPFGGYLVSFSGNASYNEEILLTNNTTLLFSTSEYQLTNNRSITLEEKTCVRILYWDGRKYNGTIMVVSGGGSTEYYEVDNGIICMYLSNNTYMLRLLNASIPLSWKIRGGEEKTIFIPPSKVIRRIEPSMIQEFLLGRGFSYKYMFLLAIGLGASIIVSLLLIILVIVLPAPLIVGKSVSILLKDYYYKLVFLCNNRRKPLAVIIKYILNILLLSSILSSIISFILVNGREMVFVVYETSVNPLYGFIGIGVMSMIILLSSFKELKRIGDSFE